MAKGSGCTIDYNIFRANGLGTDGLRTNRWLPSIDVHSHTIYDQGPEYYIIQILMVLEIFASRKIKHSVVTLLLKKNTASCKTPFFKYSVNQISPLQRYSQAIDLDFKIKHCSLEVNTVDFD